MFVLRLHVILSWLSISVLRVRCWLVLGSVLVKALVELASSLLQDGFDLGSMLVRGWLNDGARSVATFFLLCCYCSTDGLSFDRI